MKNYNAPENLTTRRILLSVRHCSHCGLRGRFAAAGPRRPCHTATRAHQHSGARGEQGVPRGSCRRHPELHMPTMSKPDHTHGGMSRFRLRLYTLHTAGHPVRQQ